jgi:hypothetical protein
MHGTIRTAAHWSEIELRLHIHVCHNSYTHTGYMHFPQKNSSQPLAPIFPLIPLGAFHTRYSVSKNRLISAAVRFSAKSKGCIFSDNLIIISWGQLQGYSSVARDTFVGLGIICTFLPIHFAGLINACGIRHHSTSLCSSLAGNNYCWCRKYENSIGRWVDRGEFCRVSYCYCRKPQGNVNVIKCVIISVSCDVSVSKNSKLKHPFIAFISPTHAHQLKHSHYLHSNHNVKIMWRVLDQ